MYKYNTPKNTVEFKVYGKYALFTDPITKLGGEKCTYQIPTYEAIKGIAKSIYWKPTFIWVIDEIRVMKRIEMQTKGIRPINYDGGNTLSIYTYLYNVEYRVRAHFEWNEFRSDLSRDRNDGKHFAIAKRSIESGGRQDIFLGTRECQGYVEPCVFSEDKGAYDDVPKLTFGMMFHGFGYPDETDGNELKARLWNAEMQKGIIKFPKPQDCNIMRKIKPMYQKRQNYTIGKDFLEIDREYENIFSNKEMGL
jgi:CRISPR-associated protein Cas5d